MSNLLLINEYTTTIHFDMVRAGDDYRLKEWITIEISGGYQPSARHPNTIANSKSFSSS
jgi:hypothetical protein